MSNNYKRVIFVGIVVPEDMILKDLGLKDSEELFDWKESRDLDLNPYENIVGEFGDISNEDSYTRLGIVVDSGEKDYGWANLFEVFEKHKFEAVEHLRRCGVSVGAISIYVADILY